MLPDTAVLRARPDLISSVLGGEELAALDPDSGSLLMFDAVGTDVVGLLDGRRDIAAVCQELAARYAAPLDVIAVDVVRFLEQLRQAGVIEVLDSGEAS